MGSAYGTERARESADHCIAVLAANQHGVFTREQARERGISKTMIHRRVAARRWDRIHPGVFRVAGAVPSWRQSVLALCMAWGPVAVASHRCAAALWRLVGFVPDLVELIVPRTIKRKLPGIIHRPLSLPEVDVTVVESIPVTTPARTLLDIAGIVEPDVVEEALDDALRRNLVSVPRLRWRLDEVGGMGTPGTAVLRELVDVRSGLTRPKTVFERRWLRVMRRAGLPEPQRQYEVRDHGRVAARADFAYPDAKLAIEADSRTWHTGRQRFERDLARRNRLTAIGWDVIHVTWSDLDAPADVIGAIRAALSLSRRPR